LNSIVNKSVALIFLTFFLFCVILLKHAQKVGAGGLYKMSLKQIQELDRIVKKEHRNLKLELRILEIKELLLHKMNNFLNIVIDTYKETISRFNNNQKLVLSKRK